MTGHLQERRHHAGEHDRRPPKILKFTLAHAVRPRHLERIFGTGSRGWREEKRDLSQTTVSRSSVSNRRFLSKVTAPRGLLDESVTRVFGGVFPSDGHKRRDVDSWLSTFRGKHPPIFPPGQSLTRFRGHTSNRNWSRTGAVRSIPRCEI